jgi:hypothetical protein
MMQDAAICLSKHVTTAQQKEQAKPRVAPTHVHQGHGVLTQEEGADDDLAPEE